MCPSFRWVDLHRYRIKNSRLQRCKSTQRKEGHIGYALTCELIYEAIIPPLCDIVEVLNADNFCDPLSLRQLVRIDIAQTEVTNQPLLLEFSKRSQRRFDRPFLRAHNTPDTKINNIENVQSQVPEVVMRTHVVGANS